MKVVRSDKLTSAAYTLPVIAGAGDERDHLAVERSRLMRCEWDAKDSEALDFRKRLGRIWRNQLQHGSLNISTDKPIEGAGVRYRNI